ncbi:hypothetical protein Mapa_006651 [Marchantia paleacea]|nr:hypothetical protein Mapa_006651 [Marchantia paleacea]
MELSCSTVAKALPPHFSHSVCKRDTRNQRRGAENAEAGTVLRSSTIRFWGRRSLLEMASAPWGSVDYENTKRISDVLYGVLH